MPSQPQLEAAVDRFWRRVWDHPARPAVVGAGVGIDPPSGRFEAGLLVNYKVGAATSDIEALGALANEVIREEAPGAPLYLLPLAEPKIPTGPSDAP